jgi:beta-fructofuranosidase
MECDPHTVVTFRDAQRNEIEETLRIRAIFDKSVLEVFVNERTALSTRIYVDSDRCFGLNFFAEGGVNDACDNMEEIVCMLLEAQVWDGLEL